MDIPEMRSINNFEPRKPHNGHYASPVMYVINIKMHHSILTGSNTIYNTNPGEMEEQDIF